MPNDMASRIRAAIAYSGRSRDEVAARLDISKPTLWRITEGERPAKRPELAALADYTGVPLDWLVSGFPEPDPDTPARIDYLAERLPDEG